MAKKLELNKETIKHLSDQDLTEVGGGIAWTNVPGCHRPTEGLTQSPACPSGATWFTSCESNIGTCG